MEDLILQEETLYSTDKYLVNHREILLDNCAYFRLSSGYSTKKITLHNTRTLDEHFAVFNYCLSGSQNFSLTGNYLTTQANSAHCNILLLPDESLKTEFHVSGEFGMVSLFIPLKKYFEILGNAAELLPSNFKIAAEKQNVCYFKNHSWHPRVKQIIHQILFEKFSPVSEKLLLESKMLELIAIMLELTKYQYESNQFLAKKDTEKIQYAREVIEQNITDPPSLAKLAQIIGSNEFTLKTGFKKLFGLPVYQYLFQIRMSKATHLLTTTNLSIQDIAISVGYENLSAFTRAFKKEYHILPSELRKNPSLHN
jgi:AraC family transcriptional regulator, transcriptional activator of the genes for pyochelin and ferripyochelin receptors